MVQDNFSSVDWNEFMTAAVISNFGSQIALTRLDCRHIQDEKKTLISTYDKILDIENTSNVSLVQLKKGKSGNMK